MARKYIKGKDGKFQGSVPSSSSVPKSLSDSLPIKPTSKTEPTAQYVCTICGEEYLRDPGYCDETLECATDEGYGLKEINKDSRNPYIPEGMSIKDIVLVPSNRPCENCTAERAMRGFDLCEDCDNALDLDYAENGYTSVAEYAAAMGLRARPRT